jgi:hypothetical protein
VWWRIRNIKNVGEGEVCHDSVIHQMKVLAREFDKLCEKEKLQKYVHTPKWQQPDQDILKLNIDGSAAIRNNTGGWGFVIRDENGEVMGSGVGHITHVHDALHAEMIACL